MNFISLFLHQYIYMWEKIVLSKEIGWVYTGKLDVLRLCLLGLSKSNFHLDLIVLIFNLKFERSIAKIHLKDVHFFFL